MTIALAGAAAPLAQAAAADIRVGVTLADEVYLAPIFAAGKLGLFAKSGLNVKLLPIRSTAAGLEALGAGHVDMIDAPGPALAIVKAGDPAAALPGRIVATNASGFFGWTVIVNSGSGYQSLGGLRGKTFGISETGSLAAVAAALAKERGKVDFKLQAAGAGALIPMLRQQKVDAVIGPAMLTQREVAGKRARIAYDLGLGNQTYTVSALIASNDLMQKRPADLRAFLAAVAQALIKMQQDRKWSIEVLKQYSSVVDVQIVERMYDNIIRRMTPAGRTDKTSLRAAEALAAKAWDVKGLEGVDPDGLFTNEFLPAPPQ